MEKEIFLGKQKIVYFEKGKGDALIIIHGWGGCVSPADNLKFQDFLSQKGFRVLLLCLPGFGKSSLPDLKKNRDQITESVLEFIEKLNLDNFFIYGHSLGSLIALKAAKMSKRKIRGVILCGAPSPFLIKNIIKFGIFALPILLFLARALAIILPSIWFFKKFRTSIKEQFYFYKRKKGVMIRAWLRIMSKDFDETFAFREKIKTPTLVVSGIKENFVIKNGLKFFAAMPNSFSRIISGVGHSVQIETPEKLTRAIVDFRKKIA